MPAKVVLSPTQRYSYADYLTWLDDARREIIGGLVTLMNPAPSMPHARIAFKTAHRLQTIIESRCGKCEVFMAPFDVRLPVNGETRDEEIFTVVQPDICVICDPSKLDEHGCLGAPDLVVEILSPSTSKRDRNTKFELYERSGVREYWIASPEGFWVRVFRLQPNGRYDEPGTLYEETSPQPITSVVFPDEKFPVASFFE
ncbi:MAG: Uma2 family endonuclease [Thermoguttaceae bacterium]